MLPADSAWLALENSRNPMTITVMMRVDGLTAPRLREFFRQRPKFGLAGRAKTLYLTPHPRTRV